MIKPFEEVIEGFVRPSASELLVPEFLKVCEVKELIKEHAFVRV
jgi:hypothetical protein